MKYYLTEEQYNILWKEQFTPEYSDLRWFYNKRVAYFHQQFGNKLTYSEGLDEDFWGSVNGNDKDINWFLLHL